MRNYYKDFDFFQKWDENKVYRVMATRDWPNHREAWTFDKTDQILDENRIEVGWERDNKYDYVGISNWTTDDYS